MADEQAQPHITIGDVSGSTFAIGSHARAESHHGTPSTSRDDRTEQLLVAVRQLRADLVRVRASEQTAGLDAALADTEEEIVRAGSADERRLRRLRELLTDAASLTTVLSSAGAVAGLLGM
ncbi:hypothetical protein [Streptomyces rubradiris]|uniref:Uncharacterized protein n=1 Tax=Streptomyces rubradiris TaxID=285531 RepID=A0ABQ3RHA2_STRRR|nr:hypothetical protein [Streptomyces rubradiris]GHH27079.1 hypothetical protein GCM10018792_68490 [Streptomyces rubradiris]GHI55242.1 hypothetical protein Srubr_50880 [Streptomyces rubradiris]